MMIQGLPSNGAIRESSLEGESHGHFKVWNEILEKVSVDCHHRPDVQLSCYHGRYDGTIIVRAFD
jgi:hypothetical protein